MAEQEWHVCQNCHRRPVSGLWLVKLKNGKIQVKLLCAACSLSDFPQRETVERIILLKSMSRNPNAVALECTAGLVPTGNATQLRSIAADTEGQLLGLFFEMKCPKCGYVTEVRSDRVAAATKRYTHPNLKHP